MKLAYPFLLVTLLVIAAFASACDTSLNESAPGLESVVFPPCRTTHTDNVAGTLQIRTCDTDSTNALKNVIGDVSITITNLATGDSLTAPSSNIPVQRDCHASIADSLLIYNWIASDESYTVPANSCDVLWTQKVKFNTLYLASINEAQDFQSRILFRLDNSSSVSKLQAITNEVLWKDVNCQGGAKCYVHESTKAGSNTLHYEIPLPQDFIKFSGKILNAEASELLLDNVNQYSIASQCNDQPGNLNWDPFEHLILSSTRPNEGNFVDILGLFTPHLTTNPCSFTVFEILNVELPFDS